MAVPVTTLEQTISLNPSYLRLKRLLDIIFTALILLPLCIIAAIVAVLIRLDSPGPVFFAEWQTSHE